MIKYKSNLTAGIVGIIGGIVLLLIIPHQIGEDYSVTYGITSRTVPYGIAVIWIVCGILLIIQSKVFHKEKIKELDVKKETKAILYMLVLVAYAWGFTKSFLISTCLLGCATLAFTGSKKVSYYIITLLTVCILYFLFSVVLHLNMP